MKTSQFKSLKYLQFLFVNHTSVKQGKSPPSKGGRQLFLPAMGRTELIIPSHQEARKPHCSQSTSQDCKLLFIQQTTWRATISGSHLHVENHHSEKEYPS